MLCVGVIPGLYIVGRLSGVLNMLSSVNLSLSLTTLIGLVCRAVLCSVLYQPPIQRKNQIHSAMKSLGHQVSKLKFDFLVFADSCWSKSRRLKHSVCVGLTSHYFYRRILPFCLSIYHLLGIDILSDISKAFNSFTENLHYHQLSKLIKCGMRVE